MELAWVSKKGEGFSDHINLVLPHVGPKTFLQHSCADPPFGTHTEHAEMWENLKFRPKRLTHPGGAGFYDIVHQVLKERGHNFTLEEVIYAIALKTDETITGDSPTKETDEGNAIRLGARVTLPAILFASQSRYTCRGNGNRL